MRVKLGDVAVESRDTHRGNQSGLPIVGLEHLEPENVNLTEWSVDTDNTFSKMFRKGQILFGRRRAYLKKAAVAPCDGICSGDITVIGAMPNVLVPELLPFIIQNDRFFDFAVEKSAGSLSPRAKWEHLQDFEFDLPPIDEQRRLAEVLWAFDEAKQAYKKLLKLTDELVKSQFVEMLSSGDYPVRRLDEIADTRLGKMLDGKRQTGTSAYHYLANFNVQWFHFDLSKLNMMDFNETDRAEFELLSGDLLVCEGGEVGRTAIWRNELEDCYFQKALHRVRCNLTECVPEFLAYAFYHKAVTTQFDGIVSTATIAHLTGEKIRALRFVMPPLPLQNRFADFVRAADKSKFVALKTTREAEKSVIMMIASLFGAHRYGICYEQEERHDVQ
jgi:type I restriction enzyme S subunit